MKLANGTEVIVKPYQEENVEEIVNLIIRNLREVNVKDYGEEAIEKQVATYDVNWLKSRAGYAHMYVFWNENKIVGVSAVSSFGEALQKAYCLIFLYFRNFMDKELAVISLIPLKLRNCF